MGNSSGTTIDLKLKVARAQLATALDLFVRNKDPVSIHSLACGAGEVLDHIATAKGAEPLSTHILANQPHYDEPKLRGVRNKYWNAFKHLTQRDGMMREDEALLSDFSDSQNDAALFVGWHDYHVITGKLPVAAQVFQVWWYALNEDKLRRADCQTIRRAFPNLTGVKRAEQKRRLRRAVEKWEKNANLLADSRTEEDLHWRA